MTATVRRVEDDPAELVARIALSRDTGAFRQLYDHFAPRVVAYLRRGGCAPEIAEEITQDVMAKVWEQAGRYDASRAQVSTWIYCVARSRLLDRVRAAKRPAPDPTDPVWAGAAPDAPDAALGHARDRERLTRALAELPAEQAEVLRAAYIDGQSLADQAQATGVPLGTVKTRARLALQRLRLLMLPLPETDHA